MLVQENTLSSTCNVRGEAIKGIPRFWYIMLTTGVPNRTWFVDKKSTVEVFIFSCSLDEANSIGNIHIHVIVYESNIFSLTTEFLYPEQCHFDFDFHMCSGFLF